MKSKKMENSTYPTMKGIQFLVDANNEPKSVLIDLDLHGELWEDFFDLIEAEARKDEEKMSWKEVKEALKSTN